MCLSLKWDHCSECFLWGASPPNTPFFFHIPDPSRIHTQGLTGDDFPTGVGQGSTGDDFSTGAKAGAGDECSHRGRGNRSNHEKRCICVSAAITQIIKTYDSLDYSRNVNTSWFARSPSPRPLFLARDGEIAQIMKKRSIYVSTVIKQIIRFMIRVNAAETQIHRFSWFARSSRPRPRPPVRAPIPGPGPGGKIVPGRSLLASSLDLTCMLCV